MSSNIIKSTEEVVSCSDNGQHPLVYINLKAGAGQCQYCGQKFEHGTSASKSSEPLTA
ncbi:MAG: zinc-finger domain-containing protein [Mariprofundus sp.]|nr:zinc-finger domain-containing protein [Mariprofundus sp.]